MTQGPNPFTTGMIQEHSTEKRKKCVDLQKSGNVYKNIVARLREIVREIIKTFKKFKAIVNQPGREHMSILSAARVRRMLKE